MTLKVRGMTAVGAAVLCAVAVTIGGTGSAAAFGSSDVLTPAIPGQANLSIGFIELGSGAGGVRKVETFAVNHGPAVAHNVTLRTSDGWAVLLFTVKVGHSISLVNRVRAPGILHATVSAPIPDRYRFDNEAFKLVL